jgi:hypothetical protein
MKDKITCTDCGNSIETIDTTCTCGSVKKTIHLAFHELNKGIKDQLVGKVKKDSLPSKKKIRQHFISGSEQSANGEWVEKERLIDKDNNFYKEHITDETGKVIIDIEEPLDKHQGHGSAKVKNTHNK